MSYIFVNFASRSTAKEKAEGREERDGRKTKKGKEECWEGGKKDRRKKEKGRIKINLFLVLKTILTFWLKLCGTMTTPVE